MLKRRKWRGGGFTLVEIMVVVVIIGMMAATAIQTFQRVTQKARNTRFISDMRVFSGAAETFMLNTGGYLEDVAPGAVPSGFEDYVYTGKWTGETPLGGEWDTTLDGYGIKSGFGVYNPVADQTQMQAVDETFDDGDLSTGKFRKVSLNRYFYVLEDVL